LCQYPNYTTCIYRPPSTNNSVLDQLYGVLYTLTSSRCNIVLCGDFNVPNIDWNALCPTSSSVTATTLCNIASDNYLSQVVLSPIHGHNILDLVFTNFPSYIQSVEVIDGLLIIQLYNFRSHLILLSCVLLIVNYTTTSMLISVILNLFLIMCLRIR